MAKRKKTFDCGHVGFGSFCHTCREKERLQAEKKARREERRAVQAADPVDLSQVPPVVAKEARSVIARLRAGEDHRAFLGKRLVHEERGTISIPLPGWYRLLCRQTPCGPLPVRILSHEDYNHLYKRSL